MVWTYFHYFAYRLIYRYFAISFDINWSIISHALSHFVPLVSTSLHDFRAVLICLVLNLPTLFLIYLFTQTCCVYVTWNNYFLVTCSLCLSGVMLYTQIINKINPVFNTIQHKQQQWIHHQQTNNANLDYRIECNVGKTLLCLYFYLSYLPTYTHYMHIVYPSLALYLSLTLSLSAYKYIYLPRSHSHGMQASA